MFTLIKKDISFCSKYIYISILFCIASPFLLILDGDRLYQLLSFYIPMVILGVIFGKICYTEDSDDVKMFLRALPYKRRDFIISKYLEVLFLDIISIIYVSVVQAVLDKNANIETILKTNILIGGFFIVYYSIYLFLYFKKNYYTAQNTMYIVLGLLFVCVFASNRKMINNYNIEWLFGNLVVGGLYIVSLLIFLASMSFIIKGEN